MGFNKQIEAHFLCHENSIVAVFEMYLKGESTQ